MSEQESPRKVPQALEEWAQRNDPNEEPPAIDSSYDMALQTLLIQNVKYRQTPGGQFSGRQR